MDYKKIRFFWKLYWIRIVAIIGVTAFGISLVFFIAKGIQAWNDAESYLRQSQMAMIPLQLYLQLVMSLLFGIIYTYMWYWLMFK